MWQYFLNLLKNLFGSSEKPAPAVDLSSDSESEPEPPKQTITERVQGRLLSTFNQGTALTDTWFTDEIVNTYMNLLCQLNPDKKIATIVSYDFANCSANGLLKRLQTNERYRKKCKLKDADILLWPVRPEGGNHWFLILIQKEDEKISILTLDSNEEGHAFLWKEAEALANILYADMGERMLIKERAKIPLQKNARDCGSAICYWAKVFCEKGKIEVEEDPDYKAFRLEISDLLAKVPESALEDYARDFDIKTVLGAAYKPPLCR